jgi:hypothetical protein
MMFYYFKNSPIFESMYKFVRKPNTDKSASIKSSIYSERQQTTRSAMLNNPNDRITN